jgi:hypothetical protein
LAFIPFLVSSTEHIEIILLYTELSLYGIPNCWISCKVTVSPRSFLSNKGAIKFSNAELFKEDLEAYPKIVATITSSKAFLVLAFEKFLVSYLDNWANPVYILIAYSKVYPLEIHEEITWVIKDNSSPVA